MCGMVPFGEEAEDPYEIYEEIIKTELTYPNYLKDKKAKKLMDQLLNKVPEIRLGGSYAALKANAWFENFDWVIINLNFINIYLQDKLLEKELKSPYFPPLDKIITEADIKKKESDKKLVVYEILVRIQLFINLFISKIKSKDNIILISVKIHTGIKIFDSL